MYQFTPVCVFVCVCVCVCVFVCVCVCADLEIVVSIQTLSDHFDILSDPNKFGSDIWLSTTSCSFHTHSDDTKSFVLRMSTYAFTILLMHIYCGTSAVAHLLWHICCSTSTVAHLL